jgi:hypothetical protein
MQRQFQMPNEQSGVEAWTLSLSVPNSDPSKGKEKAMLFEVGCWRRERRPWKRKRSLAVLSSAVVGV